jgi:hypothetical protein
MNLKPNLSLRNYQKLMIECIGTNVKLNRYNISFVPTVRDGKKYFMIAREMMVYNKAFIIKHLHKINRNYGRE